MMCRPDQILFAQKSFFREERIETVLGHVLVIPPAAHDEDKISFCQFPSLKMTKILLKIVDLDRIFQIVFEGLPRQNLV